MAFLPHNAVPCPPVAPYAVWLGGTTHLCLWERSIDLLPQNEMKTKIYNPGGTGRACLANRMDSVFEHRKHYPASKKLQILSSVEQLMRTENMSSSEASVALQARLLFT